MSLADAVAETGWLHARVESLAAELAEQRKLSRFGDVLVSGETLAKLRAEMKATVEAFHKANPLVAGISKEELREKMGVRPEVFRGVEELLVRDKQLEVAGELVHATGRGVVLRDEEAESKKQIEAGVCQRGAEGSAAERCAGVVAGG